MNERIDELCKTIEFLREENKRIEKNKLHYTGHKILIEQNEKYIMKFEKRIEHLQDELYQIERRQEVEEMR